MQKTPLLTSEVAAEFPLEINDGFVRPKLGWSAFGPHHLQDAGGSSITSNVWIGKPAEMLAFIEELAEHYNAMKDETEELESEWNGVSLGYWEKDGLAMIGEFCTCDEFFERYTDTLWTRMENLNLILSAGNDNDPGEILLNKVVGDELDVPTRLLLAHFMTSSSNWVFEEDDHPDGTKLEGFNADDKTALRAILAQHPV